jgi:hypothetical protein
VRALLLLLLLSACGRRRRVTVCSVRTSIPKPEKPKVKLTFAEERCAPP